MEGRSEVEGTGPRGVHPQWSKSVNEPTGRTHGLAGTDLKLRRVRGDVTRNRLKSLRVDLQDRQRSVVGLTMVKGSRLVNRICLPFYF